MSGPAADGQVSKLLNDSYFLGTPLPMGGKLYFLAEKNQELRLLEARASWRLRQASAWLWRLSVVRWGRAVSLQQLAKEWHAIPERRRQSARP